MSCQRSRIFCCLSNIRAAGQYGAAFKGRGDAVCTFHWRNIGPARDLLKARGQARPANNRARHKTMKKQKTKKKLSKVEKEQQELAAKFIAESKKEVLELVPQTPPAFGVERE